MSSSADRHAMMGPQLSARQTFGIWLPTCLRCTSLAPTLLLSLGHAWCRPCLPEPVPRPLGATAKPVCADHASAVVWHASTWLSRSHCLLCSPATADSTSPNLAFLAAPAVPAVVLRRGRPGRGGAGRLGMAQGCAPDGCAGPPAHFMHIFMT